jgi:hypothetical protein
MKKQGDRFYSKHFGYGTVTRFIDERNWWFKIDGTLLELRSTMQTDKVVWL